MARAYPETAIVVVGHLLGLEVAEANVAAVEAHMIGLKRLVSMVGGLDMLENVTLATIYM
ncbi:hypothetical protein N7456_006121 [Penicillium angulare]|uniref:Uncharacterized protein n=1 Tax=Penicillium angulare TaxID=116970 RepID=A0A9W9FZT7_9EURO|nr:hypothetical protein N7456_006121 [Penicillium angulare]